MAAQSQQRAADDQVNALAVTILHRQMELDFENPNLAERRPNYDLNLDNPRDVEYLHFAWYTLTAAESIYNLVGGDPSWDRTVNGLVQSHLPVVFSHEFPCDQYSPEFVDFVQEKTEQIAPQPVCPDY